MVTFAPICVFAYKRPDHFGLTINSLLDNPEASQSDLWVFIDGPKGKVDQAMVSKVRAMAAALKGFKSVKVIERESNLGLSRSVISGISEILNINDRVIVLEDDMVTSPFFLKFMNESLELYENEDQVISIHGYVYPLSHELTKPFFIRGADCWGWGTWKRGWKLFNEDGNALLADLRKCGLSQDFDFDGAYPYSKMLEDQIEGRNDSWAIRWYASAFLKNKLTLYPNKSLVKNIGNDSSGTHCSQNAGYDVILSESPIFLTDLSVEESGIARRAFADFLRKSYPTKLKKLINILRAMANVVSRDRL